MLTVVLFILILVSTYLIIEIISSKKIDDKISKYLKHKSDKYYEDLVKYYDKNKKVKILSKINILHRINILIDKAGIPRGIFVNPITVIFFCILSFAVCYYFIFSIFKIIFLSIIISLPALLLPIFVLNTIAEIKNKKIEKVMLNFLLQLKNYTKINNDIIYAFKEVKTIEPLQGYIRKFLVEVNSGIKFEKAIENVKEKILIEKFKAVFTNMQYCYLYGGDFSTLINKNYKLISEVQKEKEAREQETMSARIVLVVLIILDLFVYFTFIKNNNENYIIMTKGIIGNLIIYWNFISIWILMFLIHKVKKLDY